jgi:hypothetical protein
MSDAVRRNVCAPSPLAGERGPRVGEGRIRGRRRLHAAASVAAPNSEATPHPSRFARHLPPQGGKGGGSAL